MTAPQIMVAPNGARRSKRDHPNLPISAIEIGECAAACEAAGATGIHAHVRDANGDHTLDADLYLAAINEIRDRVGSEFLIQITTEAVGMFSPEQQRNAVAEVLPPAASLALSELFPQGHDDEATKTAEFLVYCDRSGIAIQWILYTPEELSRLLRMQEAGLIPPHHNEFLFVLGRYVQDQISNPADLIPFLAILDATERRSEFNWATCAFGPTETAALAAAMALGGNVRVGFENNLWRPSGELAESNQERVAAILKIANSIGLSP